MFEESNGAATLEPEIRPVQIRPAQRITEESAAGHRAAVSVISPRQI